MKLKHKRMDNNVFYRLGGVSSVLSGVAIIIGKILARTSFIQAGEFFDFLSPLFGLFAVTAIYLWKRNETAIMGGVAFIILFSGISMVLCLDYFGAFILPYLPEGTVELLLEGTTGTTWAISGLIFISGVMIFGAIYIRARIFPVAASLLFTFGFITIPFGEIIPLVIVHSGSVLAGTGLIWWGIFLYRSTMFQESKHSHK